MGTLLTTRILTGIGDASPDDDDDPPECEPCGGMGRQWDPLSCSYFDCPTCGGSGYSNTEPDVDVGLDWVP
jgi:DnaJ-class molecular chaperone